jgi:hypothetical protein
MDALWNLVTSEGGLSGLLLLPGELILARVAEYAPGVYAHLSHDTGEPTTSAALGAAAFTWLSLGLLIYHVSRRLGHLVDAGWYGLRERIEGFRVFLLCRLRAREHGKASGITIADEFQLADIDIAVLEEGAKLPPGFLLSVVDLADRLQRRPSEVQQSLDNLRRHQLVNPALGSSDGFGNYSLTDSGAWYMAIHQQRQVTRQSA